VKTVKRVEIVLDSLATPRLLDALASVGATGWTLVAGVTGHGDRGARDGDQLSGVLRNDYLLTTCAPETLPALAEAVRPILRTFGGVCLVSDAAWLIHEPAGRAGPPGGRP